MGTLANNLATPTIALIIRSREKLDSRQRISVSSAVMVPARSLPQRRAANFVAASAGRLDNALLTAAWSTGCVVISFVECARVEEIYTAQPISATCDIIDRITRSWNVLLKIPTWLNFLTNLSCRSLKTCCQRLELMTLKNPCVRGQPALAGRLSCQCKRWRFRICWPAGTC